MTTRMMMMIVLFFSLQGSSSEAAIQRIKDAYWTILKLNLSVWTVIQYINVNYVPLKVQ
jgi:peroxisomal membrane protein 2